MSRKEPEPSEQLSARQLWMRIFAAIAAIIVGTVLGFFIIGWLLTFALRIIVDK